MLSVGGQIRLKNKLSRKLARFPLLLTVASPGQQKIRNDDCSSLQTAKPHT